MTALLLPTMIQADKKPMPNGVSKLTASRLHRAPRAAEGQGVTAKLKYEKIADMTVARMGHQVFPSGDGFVVVGGRTTGFQLTRTAELYQNGSWQSLSIGSAHDGAFSVRLNDGRYMVGGGFSRGGGNGQSQATDIYDPTSHTFSAGPQLTTARAQSMAINVGGLVYVSGNWYASDPTMDCYNGTAFTAVGDMDGRSNPYMLANQAGEVLVFSGYNTEGKDFGYYTFDDGSQNLLGDSYSPATGKTKYLALPFSPQAALMPLPDDARPSDYRIYEDGINYYMILTRTSNGYQLYMIDMENLKFYLYNTFNIPTTDTATGAAITWRGSVLVNQQRQELYLIGTSGPATNQTLHVISLNYISDEWTIASATGFRHNLLSASWTLLADGRLACTGGGIYDNTDAQRTVYIVTPTVAGQSDDTPTPPANGPRLVVWLKSGEKVVYELAESPITTFSGSQLVISTVKTTATYERKNVLRYTYEDVFYSGIDLQPGERRVQVNRDGDEVSFYGLPAGTVASVYAVNGMLVKQLTSAEGQPLTVSLRNHPNGVYIVKAGTETIKVMKQ